MIAAFLSAAPGKGEGQPQAAGSTGRRRHPRLHHQGLFNHTAQLRYKTCSVLQLVKGRAALLLLLPRGHSPTHLRHGGVEGGVGSFAGKFRGKASVEADPQWQGPIVHGTAWEFCKFMPLAGSFLSHWRFFGKFLVLLCQSQMQ